MEKVQKRFPRTPFIGHHINLARQVHILICVSTNNYFVKVLKLEDLAKNKEMLPASTMHGTSAAPGNRLPLWNIYYSVETCGWLVLYSAPIAHLFGAHKRYLFSSFLM